MASVENYSGNPLLKRANIPIEFTAEQIEEYIKCSKDPVYFAKKYVKIVSLDEGLVPFKLYKFQENLINNFHKHRFNICKLPRQVGKTTCAVAYLMHYIIFNDNANVALLANKAQTAKDILSRLQLSYENLPKWLQHGVKIWNKASLELDNNSKIIASSTSGSAVRGGSYNVIFLDEFAFIPNQIADEFFSSVYPTITSGTKTKVIMISTPKGMNAFYKFWMDAIRGKNEYVPMEVHWSEVPGRDEKWKQQTIANTSQEQWEQEFESFLPETLIKVKKGNKIIETTIGELYDELSNQGTD